jgi:hypothetical protein
MTDCALRFETTTPRTRNTQYGLEQLLPYSDFPLLLPRNQLHQLTQFGSEQLNQT